MIINKITAGLKTFERFGVHQCGTVAILCILNHSNDGFTLNLVSVSPVLTKIHLNHRENIKFPIKMNIFNIRAI